MAEIMALASLTPFLRPESREFDAWAAGIGRVADHPTEALLDAGLAAMGDAERERVPAACVRICGPAWARLRAEVGSDAEATTLLLRGAVLAGLHEREPIPELLFAAVERHRERCAEPLCALATVLNATDVWGVVETAEIDDESAGGFDRAVDHARLRWTADHARRLEWMVDRVRAALPSAPSGARAALEEACGEFDRDPVFRLELGVILIDHAIDLLDAIAPAA